MPCPTEHIVCHPRAFAIYLNYRPKAKETKDTGPEFRSGILKADGPEISHYPSFFN